MLWDVLWDVAGFASSRYTVEVMDYTIFTSFKDFRDKVTDFTRSTSNCTLLTAIRAFNHEILDHLDNIYPLAGAVVLDLGASPHGYALERAIDHGASLYLGIGLDVAQTEVVIGQRGTAILTKMDAAALALPNAFCDAVVSISTMEHVANVPRVLEETRRVLKPGGVALITFEPIWTSARGHHLHHFGEYARLIPPWAHLMWDATQMRKALAAEWPATASISLEDAVAWTYAGDAINRVGIREHKACLLCCGLEIEWLCDLKEPCLDPTILEHAARTTGLSFEELQTKGLSVLLRKRG